MTRPGWELNRAAYLAASRMLASPLRTVLATAGMAVSVGAMVFLLCCSDSVFEALLGGLERAGGRTLYVVPDVRAAMRSGRQPPLSKRDAALLQTRLDDVEIAAPLITTSSIVRACGRTQIVRLVGVLPLNEVVDSLRIARGRFITDLDNRFTNWVAVLGSGVAKTFPCLLTGTHISVGPRTVRVVGWLRPKGQMILGDFDDAVLVPLTVADVFQPDGAISHRVIMVLVKPGRDAESVKLQVARVLREAKGVPPDADAQFQIVSHTDVMRNVGRVREAGVSASLALSGVGLIIGLIGLANSIFASVLQRINEIGTLRCVGARRRDIRRMFVLEATAMATWGAVVGDIVGVIGVLVCLRFAGVEPVIRPVNVVMPDLLAIGAGVVAALWPAECAARLPPAVAVSHE
jgi:putative ABC transport system permease protein